MDPCVCKCKIYHSCAPQAHLPFLRNFLCSVTAVLLVNKHFFRKINLRTRSNLQGLFICWPLLTSAHIIKLALHKADLSQNSDINEVGLGFFSFIFILGSSDLVPNSDTQDFYAAISCSKFSFVPFNWTHSLTLEAVMPHLCLHLAPRRHTEYSSIAWLIMDHSHRHGGMEK